MGIVFGNLNDDAGVVLRTDTHGAYLPNLPVFFDGLRVDAKRYFYQVRAIVAVLIINPCLSQNPALLFTVVCEAESRTCPEKGCTQPDPIQRAIMLSASCQAAPFAGLAPIFSSPSPLLRTAPSG